MKSLGNYVDARLNFESAEEDFIKELAKCLHIGEYKIKKISMRSSVSTTVISQTITVEFFGKVQLSSEDLFKIGNCRVVMPNEIEIDVGEIHL